ANPQVSVRGGGVDLLSKIAEFVQIGIIDFAGPKDGGSIRTQDDIAGAIIIIAAIAGDGDEAVAAHVKFGDASSGNIIIAMIIIPSRGIEFAVTFAHEAIDDRAAIGGIDQADINPLVLAFDH